MVPLERTRKGPKVQWSVFCGKVMQRRKGRHEKDLDFFFPLHFSQSLEFAEKSFLILTARPIFGSICP